MRVDPSPILSRWTLWPLSFAAFSPPLFATMAFARHSAGPDFDWLLAAASWAPIWYGWAALVPVLIPFGTRFPLVGEANGKRLLGYVLLLAMIVPAHASLIAVVQSVLPAHPHASAPPAGTSRFTATFLEILLGNADFELMFFVGTLALSQGVVLHRRSHHERLRSLSVERELADARVEALTRQLQPHFLFNALHAASSVALRDPETARRMMLHLRDLLQHSLADESGIVTIERELDLLADYLAIEYERFPDRLRVELAVSDDARPARVPRLILQPLVENAIRHGIAASERPGLVRVEVRRAGERLAIRVEDDGARSEQEPGTGIGLSNTSLRLRHLYGDSHQVVAGPRFPAGWVVELELPFQSAGTPEKRDDRIGAGLVVARIG